MNRTILIVLCDFLLVSLLAFTSVDISRLGEESTSAEIKMGMTEMNTNAPDAGRDLAAVMKMALEDEQKRRELLLGELEQARQAASSRQEQLQTIDQQLQSANQRLDTVNQRLQTREQQHAQLQQQQATLQQQFAMAQSNISNLSKDLRASSVSATMSKEKLAEMEAELRRRAEEAAAMKERLAQLAQTNQAVLQERQQLATQLQVAEVEKRHATEQVVAMKEQVQFERAEKAKLAEGVKALATNSTELAQEIRENRPLSPNTIFEEFTANRVQANFHAQRSGLFGADRRKQTATVLVSNGTNTYALCHVQDTPVNFGYPGSQWDQLTGTLAHGTAQVPIESLLFHLQDPRIVFMPVSATEAKQLGTRVYRISDTPFKFQDAVLVGAGEGYYGECRFEMDMSTPSYVKLDRSFVKGLFGKFNPSPGDLVFSKQGDLLGIMANNTYCLLMRNFDAMATIQFGTDVRAQNTGNTLAAMYGVVQGMPFKLQ